MTDTAEDGEPVIEWAVVMNAIGAVERLFDTEAEAHAFVEESATKYPGAFSVWRREVGPWVAADNGGSAQP